MQPPVRVNDPYRSAIEASKAQPESAPVAGIKPASLTAAELFQKALNVISRVHGIEPPQVEVFSDPMRSLEKSLLRSSPHGKKVMEVISASPEELHKDPNRILTSCDRDLKTGLPFYQVVLEPELEKEEPAEKNRVAIACASSIIHQAIAMRLGLKKPSFVPRMAAIIETPILLEAAGLGSFNAEKLDILSKSEGWEKTLKRLGAKGAVFTNDPDLEHMRASLYAAKLFRRFQRPEDLANALLIVSTHPVPSGELPQEPDMVKLRQAVMAMAQATQSHEDQIKALCGTEQKILYPGETVPRIVFPGGISSQNLSKAAAARKHVLGLSTPEEAEQMQREIAANPPLWLVPGDETLKAILQRRKDELIRHEKEG